MEIIKDLFTFENSQTNSPQEIKTCEYCHKPYVYKIVPMPLGKGKKIFYEPNCNCAEIEEQKRLEEERQAKIAKYKAEKLEMLFNNSQLPPLLKERTFETLIRTPQLITCERFVNDFTPGNSHGLQLIGNVGTGKTSLLAAICNQLITNGHPCLFATLSSLLDKFSSYSFAHHGDINGLLQWLKEFDFVCLDDIGRESYTDRRKELAFRIIDTLLNYKVVTAFTANPEMLGRLTQIPEWQATIDRLKDLCRIRVEFRGESFRGK